MTDLISTIVGMIVGKWWEKRKARKRAEKDAR